MEEHHQVNRNKLHEDFKKGIILHFALEDESKEVQDKKIKEIEEEWEFCGGRDAFPPDDEKEGSISSCVLHSWEKLWNKYFPHYGMPEGQHYCVCGQTGLRYNCYITDGVDVITIGTVCMRQFIKKSEKFNWKNRCDRCLQPHKNRKDNYCSTCRPIIEKEKEEEKKRIEEEIRKKQQQEIDQMWEKLRIQREMELERKKVTCQCGAMKSPNYDCCWKCFKILTTCPKCNKFKKSTFQFCFNCK